MSLNFPTRPGRVKVAERARPPPPPRGAVRLVSAVTTERIAASRDPGTVRP